MRPMIITKKTKRNRSLALLGIVTAYNNDEQYIKSKRERLREKDTQI